MRLIISLRPKCNHVCQALTEKWKRSGAMNGRFSHSPHPSSSELFSQSALPSQRQRLGTHWLSRPPHLNSDDLHVLATGRDTEKGMWDGGPLSQSCSCTLEMSHMVSGYISYLKMYYKIHFTLFYTNTASGVPWVVNIFSQRFQVDFLLHFNLTLINKTVL